ncbi:MAG: hypothetical protein WAO98_00970, partial [Alphaproteobacteria bacterium]
AQTDHTLAHAWALRNADANVAIAIGTITTEAQQYRYIVTNGRDEFFASLHHGPEGSGGFIHEVDASTFDLTPDRVGQKKWMSEKPARIIGQPHFVRFEDIMQKGVQIFVVTEPHYLDEFSRQRQGHAVVLQRGIELGTVMHLNQEYKNNPIPVPEIAAPLPGAEPSSLEA